MKQSLQLKASQRLALTPQLKKSLELLQLSSLQLEKAVEQELVDNPLLEYEGEQDRLTLRAQQSEQTTEHVDLRSREERRNQEWLQNLDVRGSDRSSANANVLEQTLASHTSLTEHLLVQISLSKLNDRDREIATHLIHSLDDDGYLEPSGDELMAILPSTLAASKDEVDRVLGFIKTLDPVGVGAADLRERLQLLLQRCQPSEPGLAHAQNIVDSHFSALAKRDFAGLTRRLRASQDELRVAIDLIKQQNPRIANQFLQDNQDQITADIEVCKETSNWMAHLNASNRISLRVNTEYEDLAGQGLDEQGNEFLERYLQLAKEFIKGLHSRYDTLLTVANCIVQHQQEFFDHGDAKLRALTMKDVADKLEIHESTVSRAIAGKYLVCNQGVYALKYFFSGALGSDDGVSSTAIRSLIKQMVAAEPSHKPLSDSKIAQQLSQEGHSIARRTVAKYRESLQIAPSNQRKTLSQDSARE